MGYCFICGDQCDGASVKTVAGIKIEMATKAGWLPSRIPRRLAGPNPRNWWQDTVHQSISSNWNLCGPCATEFDGASSGRKSEPPPPPPVETRVSIPAAPAAPTTEDSSAKASGGGTKIATRLDTSAKPAPGKVPDSPALKALKRNQLIALSPGSLGVMIAIVMFATSENGVPFSFLLVPLSLVGVAILGVLVLEGRKVQLARAALEEQIWGTFLQNTFQAWRGGLLDELAAWYRSAPANAHGFQDFIAQNIEIRAFRKVGLWFAPESDEFLVEVDGQGKGKLAFLLTNRRAILLSGDDGYVAVPWAGLKKIASSRTAHGAEIAVTTADGQQSIPVPRAPSDKSLDFLVKKQGVPLSGARVATESNETVARTVESVVANAATVGASDLEWLAGQGNEAFLAIQGISDRLRSGEWALGEALGRLCGPLGDQGTEDARRLLTTLLQLPDPTREAEMVREGAARGLERLRSRS